jgi:iron complex outermembrane receptor protein
MLKIVNEPNRLGFICLVGAMATVSLPTIALAQVTTAISSAGASGVPANGDIIVTATRREESIQKVPLSITAFSEKDLLERGADKIEDYARTVPGLLYSTSGGNSGTLEMRGISTSTVPTNTQSPVALYYDDIPLLDSFANLATPDLRLFDVQRIEVLRGPQGTLFGSGSLGGAIRIITNKPQLDGFHIAAESTLSTTKDGDPSYAMNGMVNIPIVDDKLALRLVGYYRKDGGWVDHPDYGSKNDNSERSYGGRAMLRFVPVERLTLTGYAGYENNKPDDSNYSFYDNQQRAFSNQVPQPVRQKLTTFNLTGVYDFDAASLTSVTTYQIRKSSVAEDFTPVNASVFGVSTPAPDIVAYKSNVFTQEVRLASTTSGPFQYVIGGYFTRDRNAGSEQIFIPGAGTILAPIGFPSDYLYRSSNRITTQEEAIFGELSYQITDKLKATAGARAFRNIFDLTTAASGVYNGGDTSGGRRSVEKKITPKFVLSYQARPDLLVYAQAAQGYRVGASAISPPRDPITGQAIPQSYGPDSLWNYEIGMKSSWFDHRLTLNVAAYYIDWSRIQLQVTSPGFLVYTTNAGDAHSEGLEFELRGKVTKALEVGTAISINRSRLDKLAPGSAGLVGDRLPGAARFTASSFVRYDHPISSKLDAYIYLDHSYIGKSYTNLDNPTSLTIGNYNIFDARLGVVTGPVEIVTFVTNIGNSDGKLAARSEPAGIAAARLQPRTFGLTVRFHS